ncbi:EcsC family protein [Rufibacter tibetensis]|uniref:ABC transporter-associated protein EcsC n=1 Tax=Rufibacter tibetensis TaxID=512763 RepID=A0A0P0C4J2_9BACT|nr:EcsC family protein [Rufibacter tibetensis]ALJ00070.1 ABC transporter-associated protein EcsC [Rufibacter tibetensis]
MTSSAYEEKILLELQEWKQLMQKEPSLLNHFTRDMQQKLNSYIPEKVHQAITAAIKQMIRAVLFGATHTTSKALPHATLEQKEAAVLDRISFYKKTAAAEGGITGAGGILLGLADFPLLLGIKLKMLFDIAALYGHPVDDYRERVYLLHIFQLAFSGQQQRREVYLQMVDWETQKLHLPQDIHQFDWRTFQQEYRDYIDLPKLVQLIPVIGAPVGAVVNYKLLQKLGTTAMNAYRMRWLEQRFIDMGNTTSGNPL